MKFKPLRLVAAVLLVVVMAGCGGGHDNPPDILQTQILSDSGYDGDIEQTGPSSAVVTQGMGPQVQNVFAGIDPVSGDEFRAFLHFPLDTVPGQAHIDSAFLEIYIDDIQPTGAVIPVRIDLVSFQQPMVATDFDRTAQPAITYTTLSPPLGPSDLNKYVPIDVTELMKQAQRLGLSDFQVRILQDLGPPIAGLFTIDDTTGSNRPSFAPLLTVNYYF